jgi:hypothetical protein
MPPAGGRSHSRDLRPPVLLDLSTVAVRVAVDPRPPPADPRDVTQFPVMSRSTEHAGGPWPALS